MQAAVWREPGHLLVEERSQPQCPAGWVLVRPERVGLCGTDLSIVAGQHGRATPPLILGHEMVGVVHSDLTGAPPQGTRVVINPLLPCGQCWPCRNDLCHVCRHLRLIGIDLDGGLAELVAVPLKNVLAVDPATAVAEAALTEPLAVAIHATRRAALHPAQTVLVMGAGPIGVLLALVAAADGCRVLVSEPHPGRRVLVDQLGLELVPATGDPVEALAALTDGIMCDVTFDCAGQPPVAALLSAVTRVRGTIVLAGLYHAPAALDLHAITFTEQAFLGSRVYTHDDFQHALSLIEDETLGLDRLAVKTFPLGAVDAALQAALRSETLKVLVAVGHPNQASQCSERS